MAQNKSTTKRIMSSVKASLAVEGLKPSKSASSIGKDYLEGKISSKEAHAKIKAQHQYKFGK